jgi:hypothetical protein
MNDCHTLKEDIAQDHERRVLWDGKETERIWTSRGRGGEQVEERRDLNLEAVLHLLMFIVVFL